MIIGQVHNLHVTCMSTWWWYYLHDCMLQMWVHDDGIICTIACNWVRTMIFLIVIVNPEYHIITVIVRDSVFQLWVFLLSAISICFFALMRFTVHLIWEFAVLYITVCTQFWYKSSTVTRYLKLALELESSTVNPHICTYGQNRFFYNCSI